MLLYAAAILAMTCDAADASDSFLTQDESFRFHGLPRLFLPGVNTCRAIILDCPACIALNIPSFFHPVRDTQRRPREVSAAVTAIDGMVALFFYLSGYAPPGVHSAPFLDSYFGQSGRRPGSIFCSLSEGVNHHSSDHGSLWEAHLIALAR